MNADDSKKIIVETEAILREFLDSNSALMKEDNPVILVRIYDAGNYNFYPGVALLPFQVPTSLSTLKFRHFSTLKEGRGMNLYSESVDAAYHDLPDPDVDSVGFHTGFDKLHAQRLELLKEASKQLPDSIRVIGFTHSDPFWRELAIHVYGPALPDLPPPTNAVDFFSRFARATNRMFGKFSIGRFQDDRFVGVDLTWAGVDTIQTILSTPDIEELCRDMLFFELSIDTKRDMKQLISEKLPHIELRTP